MIQIKNTLSRFFLLLILTLFCRVWVFAQITEKEKKSFNSYCECENTFTQAENSTEENAGFSILRTGFKMSMVDRTILKGSCWDFVNAVYNKSGFEDKKETIFSSKKRGPYAPASMVKSGDWIYHINHQFNNIEHSAIFICWKDFSKRIGITLSYAGGNRNEPGKFGEYTLNNIYSIFRPIVSKTDSKSNQN